MMRFGPCALLLGVVFCPPTAAYAQGDPPSVTELKQLTVAELMNVDVTSVSRAAEPRDQAAAAVTVVTAEDIRRSGATSVPEALRLVPGIYVGRQNASTWAVASRGFSNVNSEKLLVLSDTRSIYTPLFSGVLWDVQDYLLQDIERIEVIRGPGATLWGSNAVNGVINITTKSAEDTPGAFLAASLGTQDRVTVDARYGGRLSDRAHYRVFARQVDRAATAHSVAATSDDWQSTHLGFRADAQTTATDSLTLQGDLYRGDIGQLAPVIEVLGRPGPAGRLRVRTGGGNLLGRWRHTRSPASGFEVRAYYDRTWRDDPSFDDDLDTLDVDFQHRFALARRHGLTWGAHYRHTWNTNRSNGIFNLDPASSRDHLVSGFVQDQIRVRESLHVTLGTKLEHNSFSGAELQPSGRIAWDVTADHFVWGAVSRAVRVPTRLERDVAIDAPLLGGLQVRLLGNPAFDPEHLLAYEGGYRWQALRSLALDTAAFYNRYAGLASLDLGEPFTDAASGEPVIPLQYQNLNHGRATGFETLVTYSPIPWSRLTASYSYLNLAIETDGRDINRDRFIEGSTPRHQFGLRAAFDLPRRIQLEAGLRSLSAIRRLPQLETAEGLPDYAELDVRLAWTTANGVTLSLVGQSLLHGSHLEFGAPGHRGAIERAVYTRISWGF